MVERMELYWIFGAYTFLMFGIGIYILYNGSFQKKAAEDDARSSISTTRSLSELDHHFLGGKNTSLTLLILTVFFLEQ